MSEHSSYHTHNILQSTVQERFPNSSSETETTSRATTLTAIQPLHIAQIEWRKVLGSTTESGTSIVNREIVMTQQNLRTNVAWGDKKTQKEEGILRVYVANVNGFSLDRRGGQYDNFCRILKEVQADIICGQEHNLDSTKSAVKSMLNHTTYEHWKRSRIIFHPLR